MDALIPVINKLQDVFHSVGMLDTIDLPQIAVVGSQSSGKSSVLEAVVGRDFLPRGSGIVTRRPLVLQLLYHSTNSDEWGEFLHIPNKKFFDFDQIRQEIVNETDRVTGSNKGISPLPIHLRVYSPNVLNLTLVDLPGITKVPVGDQPPDIEKQIRKMILQYISRPNCVILAVSPANSDLANSEALKLAREVDPKGDRTLGVLSKLDLMDAGTDAMDVLMGRVIPLKKGYIGVVNRSQKDIDAKRPIRDALNAEMEFFHRHPSYKNIAERMGTTHLVKTLNKVLLQHIRDTLPETKSKIAELISKAQQVIAEYGSPLESRMSQGALVLKLLTEFAQNYCEAIDGISSMTTSELFGGARVNHIFTDKYSPTLGRIDACEGLSEKDMKMAIRNAKGPRTTLFVPEGAFDMLVKKQAKLLEDPSLRCVDQVFDELLRIVEFCEKRLLRFPTLREKVVEFVVGLLRGYLEPLREFIMNLIEIEMSYINTNHPDFFNGGHAIKLLAEHITRMEGQNPPVMDPSQQAGPPGQGRGVPPQTRPPQPGQPQQPMPPAQPPRPLDKERMEIDIIRLLLVEYFGIMRKNIADNVPKAIMFFLVNKSKLSMQSELVRNIYKEELFEELLHENEEIAAKRKAAHEMLKVLYKAKEIIDEVREVQV